MEAPEKIYVKITHPISDKYTELIAFEHGNGIEYTRTDALIEKACKWLKENKNRYVYNKGGHDNYIPTCSNQIIEDFKKYMKGE